MASRLFVTEDVSTSLRVCSDRVHLKTHERLQIIDVTELVKERVRRSRIRHGIACVQTHHTTTAVLVNENEPLLLEDLKRTLERLAPGDLMYAHDDLSRRRDVPANESRNGDAHCRAALLGASQCLAVADGRLQLGPWQSLFLAELDGPRDRTFSVVVMGSAEEGREDS